MWGLCTVFQSFPVGLSPVATAVTCLMHLPGITRLASLLPSQGLQGFSPK